MPQFWRHFCGSGSLLRRKETKENLLKTKQSQIMMLCIGLMNADFLTHPFLVEQSPPVPDYLSLIRWAGIVVAAVPREATCSHQWFTPTAEILCPWELLATNCRRHYVWSCNPQSDKEKWSNARVRCNRSSANVTTCYDIPLFIWSLRLWS